MLEGDGVRNLESENYISQQTRAEPILYREDQGIITAQPRPPQTIQRLPISTVQVGENTLGSPVIPFIPRSGIDTLRGQPSIHIQQTFELTDNLSSVSSENRYTVRAGSGEALFFASETSTKNHRLIWGSSRPFSMHLTDKGNQESMTLHRSMGIGPLCCTCVSQSLQVWTPPGDLLGFVEEGYSFTTCDFVVLNGHKEIMFHICGPKSYTGYLPKEASFRMLSPDYLTQVGTISRSWNVDISMYSLNVYFTDQDLDVKIKALFLGAAFLMEYMYFQGRSCCGK
ncbi:Phospholipid scramblase [Sergentomyia squamirostris]